MRKRMETLRQRLRLARKRFKAVRFLASVEKEPKSAIYRAGVGLALPLYEPKEAQLGRIDLLQAQRELESYQELLAITLTSLQDRLTRLKEHRATLGKLLANQRRLVSMARQRYRIDKSRLDELIRLQKELWDLKIQELKNRAQELKIAYELRFFEGERR